MKIKNTVLVISTTALLASDLIHIDKRHLHNHNEPETPLNASINGYVYGQIVFQSTVKKTYSGSAKLVTMI